MYVIDNAVDFCELNDPDLANITHLYLPFNYLDKLFSCKKNKKTFLYKLDQCKNLQSLNLNNNNLNDSLINEVYSHVQLLKKTKTRFQLPDGWHLAEDLSQEDLLEIIEIAEHKCKQNPLIKKFHAYSEEDGSNSNFPVPVLIVDKKAFIMAKYVTDKIIDCRKTLEPAIYKSDEPLKARLINTWLQKNYMLAELQPCDEDIRASKKLRFS